MRSWPLLSIREPAVELLPAAIIVHCACGEQTEHANGGWPETQLDCVCGRSWSVRLTVEPTEAPAELALIGCA